MNPPHVSADDVRAAHHRIAEVIRRTPLLDMPHGIGRHTGSVNLKLELVQHAGSFKSRGVFNTLLSSPVGPSGVTAASGGNHGVAVALAASRLGYPARIFVPEIASPVKVAAIRAHGAVAVVGGALYADAQEACDAFARQSGALRVHPYDAPATVAGQGTVALEWEEDLARLAMAPVDTVLVATGGGGLVAGIAAWWSDRVRVVGVEPVGSRALHAALEAGAPVDVEVHSVAADSLGARRAGAVPFAIARERVNRVVLVDDDAIVAAQRLLWRELRIATEPGGAAALGALLSGAYPAAEGERVGVLLCGGNVDLATLAG